MYLEELKTVQNKASKTQNKKGSAKLQSLSFSWWWRISDSNRSPLACQASTLAK